MKKLYTLIALLLTCNALFAQHMSVESFSALESDMDARTYYPKIDLNGRKAALIKVESLYKGFSFDVGSLGIVDVDHSKTAETWVYVPSGAIRITIQHAELGTIREYEFPISIREATVYRMVLTTDLIETVVHQRANGQYLALSVTPNDVEATISVDYGAQSPIVGGEFSQWLSRGVHTYTVSAPMYQDYTRDIIIDEERIIENVVLLTNFATLTINSNPVAKVSINNMNSGSTPLSQDLELGEYTIKLSATNYQPYTQVVTLATPLENVVINKELEPYFSQISLTSSMSEAKISINDEPRGTGSWSGTLMPATYIVKCERDGYRPTLYTLEVQSNTPQNITLESPTPIYGSLNVNSNTLNANLYVDGELLGQTPNFFENIIIGNHKLELSKEGYLSQSQTITVSEGRISEVNFTLQRDPALVEATPAVTQSRTTPEHINLAELSATNYPYSNNWIIDNGWASNDEFSGLRKALYSANAEGRKISLSFPALTLIPSSNSVKSGAFSDCNAIIAIYMPKVSSVGAYAFANCSSLNTVDMPLASTVRKSAFENCSSLTTIELAKKCIIADRAFENCTALKHTPISYVEPVPQTPLPATQPTAKPTTQPTVKSTAQPKTEAAKSEKSKGKFNLLLLAQQSPNTHYTTNGGMVGGIFNKRNGFYLSYGSHSSWPEGLDDLGECTTDGYIGNTQQSFTGEVYVSRESITAGYIQRLGKPLYMYVGGGLGSRNVAWETTTGSYAQVTDLSVKSTFALEAGGILKLGPIALSAGYRTAGLKFNELTLGAGLIF